MRKIMIASHGKTASGIKSSVELFLGKQEITCIDAYLKGPEENDFFQLTSFVEGIDREDEAYIFTDLFGGSVNQKVLGELKKYPQKNIVLITNVNVAIVIELLTSPDFKTIDEINTMMKQQTMRPFAVDPASLFQNEKTVSDDAFLD